MSRLLVTDNLPRVMAEKNQRTYASWLQWWKSTVTSDDYMKYLSTMVQFGVVLALTCSGILTVSHCSMHHLKLYKPSLNKITNQPYISLREESPSFSLSFACLIFFYVNLNNT
jgi:hypothetical protein